MNCSVWTTDKDGFIPALLDAEITAKMEKDPGIIYNELTQEFGEPFYDCIEAKANPEQKKKLKKLSGSQIKDKALAGEKIENILTTAPGNNAPIGGVKVITGKWMVCRTTFRHRRYL
ncbi:MAG: hypothetical protein ABIT96_03235 [Ferruginibacter sp.]